MRALLDTNIVIDYLNGVPAAADTIERWRQLLISRISWLEVLAGVIDTPAEAPVRAFLGTLRLIELTPAVAEETIRARQQLRLRLPDAIILATARVEGATLLTRDTKHFDPSWPEVREPYRL